MPSCCFLISPSQQEASVLCNIVPTLQMRRLRPSAGVWFPGGYLVPGFQMSLSQRDILWIGQLSHPEASCQAHPGLFVPFPLFPPDPVCNCLFLYCQYLWGRDAVGFMHVCTSAPRTAPAPRRHSSLLITYKLNQISYMREEPVGRKPPLGQQVDPHPSHACHMPRLLGGLEIIITLMPQCYHL